jgi:hypothetical protein
MFRLFCFRLANQRHTDLTVAAFISVSAVGWIMYRSDSLLIPASSAINRDFYSAAAKLSPTSAKMAHLASHHHNGYSFDAHTSPLPRRKQVS